MRGENFGCDDPYRLVSGRKYKAKIWIPREGQLEENQRKIIHHWRRWIQMDEDLSWGRVPGNVPFQPHFTQHFPSELMDVEDQTSFITSRFGVTVGEIQPRLKTWFFGK